MTCEIWPGLFPMLLGKLRESLNELGKDPLAYPNILYHNINIGTDKMECLAESKRFLDQYYGPVFSEKMVSAWTAAGTPTEVIDHIRALRDQGAQSITLRITSWDQAGQYQRLVNEVLPYINEDAAA